MNISETSWSTRAACFAVAAIVHMVPFVSPHKPERSRSERVPASLISTDIEFQAKSEDNLIHSSLHLNCPRTYDGIGIKIRWGGMVTEVANGWPADRAGIKVGDVIEPWFFGVEGGFMSFDVHREGRVIKMRIKTEKICFRDRP